VWPVRPDAGPATTPVSFVLFSLALAYTRRNRDRGSIAIEDNVA